MAINQKKCPIFEFTANASKWCKNVTCGHCAQQTHQKYSEHSRRTFQLMRKSSFKANALPIEGLKWPKCGNFVMVVGVERL